MNPLHKGSSREFWSALLSVDIESDGTTVDSQDPYTGGYGTVLPSPEEGLYVYKHGGLYGSRFYVIEKQIADRDFSKAIANLKKRKPESLREWIKPAFNEWLDSRGEDQKDIDKLIKIMLKAEKAYWDIERPSVKKYLIESEINFKRIGWPQIKGYWKNIVFEFFYISFICFFLVWPYLRKRGWKHYVVHVTLFPTVLLIPYFLGYAAGAQIFHGPLGGVLYPWFILFVPRFWTFIDSWYYSLDFFPLFGFPVYPGYSWGSDYIGIGPGGSLLLGAGLGGLILLNKYYRKGWKQQNIVIRVAMASPFYIIIVLIITQTYHLGYALLAASPFVLVTLLWFMTFWFPKCPQCRKPKYPPELPYTTKANLRGPCFRCQGIEVSLEYRGLCYSFYVKLKTRIWDRLVARYTLERIRKVIITALLVLVCSILIFMWFYTWRHPDRDGVVKLICHEFTENKPKTVLEPSRDGQMGKYVITPEDLSLIRFKDGKYLGIWAGDWRKEVVPRKWHKAGDTAIAVYYGDPIRYFVMYDCGSWGWFDLNTFDKKGYKDLEEFLSLTTLNAYGPSKWDELTFSGEDDFKLKCPEELKNGVLKSIRDKWFKKEKGETGQNAK